MSEARVLPLTGTDSWLQLPPPPGCESKPVWTGRGFLVGDRLHPVLSYQVQTSGWTDELTDLHEDVDDEYHYMSLASREHAIGAVERWMSVSNPVVLDIGCSSGYTLKHLSRRIPGAHVLGADYVRGPLEKLAAQAPGTPLLQFDLTKCPLPANSVDVVVLLNVLEHIDEDSLAVHQVHRILRSGGIAVIEVPAGPQLYDIYDRRLMHFRRYSLRQLRRMMVQTGFEVLASSHLGFFLYAGFWAAKKRNRLVSRASSDVHEAIISRDMRRMGQSGLLKSVMRLENSLRRWVQYPFGIRCLVTCRKP